ncbi:cell division inhibitor SepF [Lachnospiraceae bacterium]|nr:cell division inhibitor SepF [Lachnospiraceae bacterium]
MGLLDKLVHVMNIDDEDEDYDYDDDEFYDEDDEPAQPRRFFSKKEEIKDEETRSAKSNIMPMRQARKRSDGRDREICMFKPKTSDESCDIIDALLSDRTAVLNLEGINEDLAQKIIDQVSGACYALKAHILKISNYIFIIAPKSVELSGENQGDMMQEAFDLQAVVGRM